MNKIDTNNIKVLLVEDDMTNQMLMKMALTKFKLSYDLAEDGIEAIDLFKKSDYDLVLMDENMPNMNGTEATGHIRDYEKENNLNHTPIIALSASELTGDRERFLAAGMDEFLSKPAKLDKLKAVIYHFLEKEQ